MTPVYRLLRRPFSANPFDGEGSFRFGGRWSRPGTRLVYTAEHLSLAMLEYLVHLDADRPPRDLVLATAEVPDDVARIQLPGRALPPEWRDYPAPEALSLIGDRFAQKQEAAILVVPSAIAPTDNNWILNPNHPDFERIVLHPASPFEYDSRVLKAKR